MRNWNDFEVKSSLTAAKKLKLKNWATLHNRLDDMNEQTNPDLPTLQAWRVTNAAPASRLIRK